MYHKDKDYIGEYSMIMRSIVLVFILFTAAIVVSLYYVVTSKKPEDEKINYIKRVSEILERFKLENESGFIREKIDKIIEELRYSDVNSPPVASTIEKQILSKTEELFDSIKTQKSAEKGITLDEILKLVKERNIIVKNNK